MKGSEPPRIKSSINLKTQTTMKTRKHGNGLSHKEVVKFSNRLAAMAQGESERRYTYTSGFNEGWAAACRYFAHELRATLRYHENNNEQK